MILSYFNTSNDSLIASAALFTTFILRRELITSWTFVARGKTNCGLFFLSHSQNLMLYANSSIRKYFTLLFNKLAFSSLLTITCVSDNKRPVSWSSTVLITFTCCLKKSLLNKVGIWYLLIVNFLFPLLSSIFVNILENVLGGSVNQQQESLSIHQFGCILHPSNTRLCFASWLL